MSSRWAKWTVITAIVLAAAPSASAQFQVSGLVALIARNGGVNNVHNTTNLGVSPFDAAQARVFLDGRITDRLSGFVQFYSGKNYDAFLYGAYIRYDHTPSLHLEAGLIPVPVGLWSARTYPDKNPLVGVPLMYQYKTGLDVRGALQEDAGAILSSRAQGANTPLAYDFCWNTGVHGYASVGPFDVGAALQTGSLGSPSRDYQNDYPNLLAHAAWVPGPWLKVGVWGGVGPYLNVQGTDLPEGANGEDYHQRSAGAVLHVAYGHWEVYGEGILNQFEHPYLGDLNAKGGYLDVRYAFAPRWYGAARAEGLTFSHLDQDIDPNKTYWEFPLRRFEVGLGYKMTRRTRAKAVTQFVRYTDAPSSLDDEIYALQFVFAI